LHPKKAPAPLYGNRKTLSLDEDRSAIFYTLKSRIFLSFFTARQGGVIVEIIFKAFWVTLMEF
jgi:hypothetical protein